jgi:hypothetical protein
LRLECFSHAAAGSVEGCDTRRELKRILLFRQQGN